MQGSMVDFPVNGKPGNGYLAVPESGGGPGVIVIQEWWGVDRGTMKKLCDSRSTATAFWYLTFTKERRV